MSRTKAQAAAFARMAAEDRAVAYLTQERLSPRVSMAVAIRVEFLLAVIWEAEQEAMRDDDPREVIEIVPREMQEARKLFVRTPPGTSDAVAEQHVVDMLTKFPPDRAWWISRKVRRAVVHYQEMQIRRSQEPATPPLADLLKSGLGADEKLPSSIKRLIALAEAGRLATHGDRQRQ
jgi:hypothetical protein